MGCTTLNQGNLIVKKQDIDRVQEILFQTWRVKPDILPTSFHVSGSDDECVELGIVELYRDIEAELKEICKTLLSEGIFVDGSISAIGDSSYGENPGTYEIKRSELSFSGERELSLQNFSDEELLAEIQRRMTLRFRRENIA